MHECERIKSKGGFTLTELLIVISILAILAVLVYPSWVDSLRKARRTDAIQSLLDVRANQAQWRANHTTYATSLTDVGYASGTSRDGHYTIAFVGTPNATTFTVTAAPAGGQSSDDCGTYAINQDGPDQTGSYADAGCWNQ